MILMWKKHNNFTGFEKEKCEELKKELTAVQSQLSEMQGFTDKQESFCSLSV